MPSQPVRLYQGDILCYVSENIMKVMLLFFCVFFSCSEFPVVCVREGFGWLGWAVGGGGGGGQQQE